MLVRQLTRISLASKSGPIEVCRTGLNHYRCMSRYNAAQTPVVCVVGSGPAGFGIAQYLLKNHGTLKVKMLEKSPVPFGLIRYGVSPDHQDVKNCIHGYEKVAENPRFSFFGGVEVGRNLTLEELSQFAESIVLCTGAQKLQKLGVPGEDLRNVFSAKEFVGWYNGTYEHAIVRPDLSGDTALIVGVGNVALDCARMLLKPWESLADTDITDASLQALKQSNIKNVVLVGRRGPLQMACTRRELAEITEIPDLKTDTDQKCFTKEVTAALKVKNLKLRKTQRLVKHLIEATKGGTSHESQPTKTFTVKLLRSPLEINEVGGRVDAVVLQQNAMSGEDAFNPKISSANEVEHLKCSLVISAIGYGNEAIDPSIPIFSGRIETKQGRIDHKLPLYACGWCKTGPKGVLGDTLNDCLITGKTLISDLDSDLRERIRNENTVEDLLTRKGVEWFSWHHWKVIDKHEEETGAKMGKLREKVICHDDMEKIAFR